MKTPSNTQRFLNTGLGVLFLAIMLFPVYWMVNTSFQGGGSAASSSFFPTEPVLDGYRRAIDQQTGNLVTSLLVALGTVVVSLAIATPASYALAKFKLAGSNIVLFSLLIAQMIPGIVIANALYTIYNQVGLLNTIPGLILANATQAIPFAVLIMTAFMRGLPASLVEAARVDGAGYFRAFFSIIVPVSKNSIITAGLFCFLFTWSDFIFAVSLTTSDEVKPVTLGIYEYLNGEVQSWGPVLATAVLASIPAIGMLIVAQRYIAAGALGGATK